MWVPGSPYTRQGCSKFHVDEGQEDSMWLRWTHDPSTVEKPAFKKRERERKERALYWEGALGWHPEGNFFLKSLNQLENVT